MSTRERLLIQATHHHAIQNLYPVQHAEQCCAYMLIAGLLLLHMSKGQNIWYVLSHIALAVCTPWHLALKRLFGPVLVEYAQGLVAALLLLYMNKEAAIYSL